MRNRAVWLAATLWIAVMGFDAARATAVENLLGNGGFETGDLSGWGIVGAAGAQVVTTCDGAGIPEGPAEGRYCLYVTVSAAGVNFWDSSLQRHNLVFQQGKKYTLSAFFKCKAGTLTVNLKPELGADPWTGYGEQRITIGETWTEYHVTTPVFASDVMLAGIVFHVGFAAAEFWVDDIKWYEGEYVPTSVNEEPAGETSVQFADPALKAAVEACLGIADPTPGDMLRLHWANLTNRSIRDLTGLEYAKNLIGLDVSYNMITDLSPLAGLTSLRTLALYSNPLSVKACLIDIRTIRTNNPGVTIYYDGWPEQQCTLAISSSPGGSVVMPGEGPLTVSYGRRIPVEAVAQEGYQFTGWSGTAVDAGRVRDPSASHTSVVVEGDYSLVAQFAPQDLSWTAVYFNDFERQAGPNWSHDITDATLIGQRRFLGQFNNDSVRLALTDLPPHTNVRLTFDLFLLRSWDGDGLAGPPELSSGPGPDLWSLTVNGDVTLLSTTFDNHWLPSRQSFHRQSYPHNYPGPGMLPETGAAEAGTLGYARTFPETGTEYVGMDSVYHLTFTVADSAPTIGFDFAASGLQLITDESWGLDNVRVEVVDANMELITSSTPGGSVVMPGEGTFIYTYGRLVPVEAVAQAGYQFTHWSGTAVDANAMLDPCAPHTSVAMKGNYSLVAHFKPQDEPWSTVYSSDFEGQVGPEWSQNLVDATPAGQRRFLGQFGNDAVTLALTDLPAHSNVRLSFDLFVILSWDGNGVLFPTVAPDHWAVAVDERATLLDTTFDNHTGPATQAFPANYPDGQYPARTGAAEVDSLGYLWSGTVWPSDSVYHIVLTFEHRTDAISVCFAASNLEALDNESWGLDNVRVEVVTRASKATLTVSSTAGGSATVPGEGTVTYNRGESVPIQAVAEARYRFAHWSGSAVDANKVADPTAAGTTVIMDGDYTLVANFVVNEKTLTISSTAGGSVTVPGQGSFRCAQGESVAVQAAAKAHYYFTHWSGTAVDAGKVANPASADTSVTVDTDYTLVANFRIDQHQLVVSAGAGGSIYVETRTGSVVTPWYDLPVPPLDHGTEVTVIAMPSDGWRFVCWGGTMGSTESPLTFDLTDDCHLQAQFVPE